VKKKELCSDKSITDGKKAIVTGLKKVKSKGKFF